jgi:hypothetical protein
MRRTSLLVALFVGSLLLPGCPIYPNDSCYDESDCSSGYVCSVDNTCIPTSPTPAPTSPKNPDPWCSSPSDCASNETCGPQGLCLPGDCTNWGCVSGYSCSVSSGFAVCVSKPAGQGGSAGAGGSQTAGSSGEAGQAGSGEAGAGGEAGEAGAGGEAGEAGAGGEAGEAGAGGEAGEAGEAGSGGEAGEAGSGGEAGEGQGGSETAGAAGSDAGAGGSEAAGAGGSDAGTGGSDAGAGGSEAAGAGGSDAGSAGSDAGSGGSDAGSGGSDAGSGGSDAGSGGAPQEACRSDGLPVATGSVQIATGAPWQLCVGGLSSNPEESKLAIAGGDPAKEELLGITITGQNASTGDITCNDGVVTCALTLRRTENGTKVRYDATSKPFLVKVSSWTSSSFLGVVENAQVVRIELPEGNSQILDNFNLVLFANN